MVSPTLLWLCSALLPQEPAPTAVPTPPKELPKLGAPIQVEADGGPIAAVTGHAAPFVVDWDGDGVRDLVVGMFGNDDGATGGSARIYRNVGTNRAPKFTTSAPLLADGKPALMESS
jgi:hypothetical protein